MTKLEAEGKNPGNRALAEAANNAIFETTSAGLSNQYEGERDALSPEMAKNLAIIEGECYQRYGCLPSYTMVR
jgi:hypothetical protein